MASGLSSLAEQDLKGWLLVRGVSSEWVTALSTEEVFMRKLILLAAVAALFLAALPIASAGADSPFKEVTIEVDTNFGGGPPNGPFEASGSAVDAGLICESGWSFDAGGKFSPRDNPNVGVNIQAVKIFLCDAVSSIDDVPNGFEMRLQIHFGKKGGSINWVITDGWGEHESIAGDGDGISVGSMATGITDTLWGKIR